MYLSIYVYAHIIGSLLYVCITKNTIQFKSLFQKKQSTHLKMNQLYFVSSNPQFQYRIYAKVLSRREMEFT